VISKKQIIAIVLLFGLLSSVGFAQQSEGKSPAKRTAQFTEEGSEACMVCHSGEKMRAIAASPHGNSDNPSAPLFKQGCEDCHGPGSIHVSRAHGGKGFPKMILFGGDPTVSERNEQVDTCLSCHTEDLGSTQAIEFRDSVHDKAQDKQGDKQIISCSNCHVIHTEFAAIREKEQQAAICYKCHEKTKAEHSRFEDKSIDFDALSCWDCHDVHKANAEQN
jgi:DmsE family decaheme c-type cytochrome